MKFRNLIGFILLCTSLSACNGSTITNDDDTTALKPVKPVIIIDRPSLMFAATAASIGLTEIEMGKLAVKKGVDKRIKNFGAMLIKDNTKANAKLEVIAKAKKISLPDTITSVEKTNIADLAKNNGKDFDRIYMMAMVKDHENDIEIFNDASKQLMDPELRAYATKNVLTLKRHLDAVNMIRASMK
jgi:putative membrane protein